MKTTLLKPIFLLSFIFICSTGNSYSQVFSGYGFKAGVVLAYHSETYRSVNSQYISNDRLGFAAGVFGEFFRYKYFSSILEANFVQKGANVKLLNPENNNYSTLNILSVPLLVKLTLDYGKVRPYISGGPRADILLSKNDGLITGQYNNINKVNFGMSVLAGAEIKMSKKTFLLAEFIYSPDISSYAVIYGNILDNISDYRNFSYEFKVGIKFDH